MKDHLLQVKSSIMLIFSPINNVHMEEEYTVYPIKMKGTKVPSAQCSIPMVKNTCNDIVHPCKVHITHACITNIDGLGHTAVTC